MEYSEPVKYPLDGKVYPDPLAVVIHVMYCSLDVQRDVISCVVTIGVKGKLI